MAGETNPSSHQPSKRRRLDLPTSSRDTGRGDDTSAGGMENILAYPEAFDGGRSTPSARPEWALEARAGSWGETDHVSGGDGSGMGEALSLTLF
jgi:hypothetical protein